MAILGSQGPVGWPHPWSQQSFLPPCTRLVQSLQKVIPTTASLVTQVHMGDSGRALLTFNVWQLDWLRAHSARD